MSYGTATLDHSSRDALIASCDGYLASREGRYEWRCQRYDAAITAMIQHGLNHDSTVVDVGAGWTELDARARTTGIRYRYWPVDGCFDGVDLEEWSPPRHADFFVALELLEHLANPWRMMTALQGRARRAVIVSTPNPRTTDVLGMDATHKTAITAAMLRAWGFEVEERSFYGQPNDSLFAVWSPS